MCVCACVYARGNAHASENAKLQRVCVCFYVSSVRKEQGTTALVGDVRILLRILLVQQGSAVTLRTSALHALWSGMLKTDSRISMVTTTPSFRLSSFFCWPCLRRGKIILQLSCAGVRLAPPALVTGGACCLPAVSVAAGLRATRTDGFPAVTLLARAWSRELLAMHALLASAAEG